MKYTLGLNCDNVIWMSRSIVVLQIDTFNWYKNQNDISNTKKNAKKVCTNLMAKSLTKCSINLNPATQPIKVLKLVGELFISSSLVTKNYFLQVLPSSPKITLSHLKYLFE